MTGLKRTLLPLCGYQGGKRRWADLIASFLLREGRRRFYDFGVGSGAVTLALLDAGVAPSRITSVDAGPWGDVWAAMGAGRFAADRLSALLDEAQALPPRAVKAWVEQRVGAMPYSPEVFVVIQAASYGSVPCWHDGSSWRCADSAHRYVARGFWEPGPGSPETKPRGTIFAPEKIAAMARRIAGAAAGLDGRRGRAEEVEIEPGSVVYIDPPYEGARSGTHGYGYSMDWRSVVARHRPVYVSESFPLPGADRSHSMDYRKRGALRGISEKAGGEWLSVWASEA